jgi:hypothetical protein
MAPARSNRTALGPNRLGPYRALGFSFAVRVDDQGASRCIAQVLAPLSHHDPPTSEYDLVQVATSRPGWELRLEGQRVAWAGELSSILPALFTDINRQLVETSASHVLVHASAAAAGDRGLIFPAASGSGKTTLVAGLVRSGLSYLTDEVTAIRFGDGRIEAYPKSLSLDPGSWGVLADLAPEPDPGGVSELLGEWHVDPHSIRADAVVASAAPAFVIAPTYEAGSATVLTAIPRSEAVFRLAQNSFDLARHRRVGLELLAQVVRRCDCYRMEVGDLDQACELVGRLVGDAPDHGDDSPAGGGTRRESGTPWPTSV